MLPPVSVPSAKSLRPRATLAAAPELLPPVTRAWPSGLGVPPNGFAPVMPSAISCNWVLPTSVAPKYSRRVTRGLSPTGGSGAGVLARIGQPRTPNRSLTLKVMPDRGPPACPVLGVSGR